MIGTTERQATLFYLAFGKQASLIKDDLLDPLDSLLDDPVLLALVTRALAGRTPRSRVLGRTGLAPDRLLRTYTLKHLKGWSFRELVRELRASLVYRRFTRFDEDPVPDFATFCRNFALLGPDVTGLVHDRVVQRAREERVATGRKLRTDTTVVESNIHHPQDSTLLADGIRVLTRVVGRIAKQCAPGAVQAVNHARAVKHRVLEIHRAAKAFTEASRDRLKDGYRKLVGIASRTVAKAKKTSEDLVAGKLPFGGDVMQLAAQLGELDHFVPLVEKVLLQTRARVFGGDNHVPGKIISIFEEHSVPIRKGKAHKPTEFGRLVRLDEVENGIVSNYDVTDGNPADTSSWTPALEQHKSRFGVAPRMATADRGFQSAANEKAAKKMGVQKVALPARGRLSQARRRLQKERWFRRLLKWRAGIEARIGTLKNRFGMTRAMYKGGHGFKRYVGWSVITHNLVQIARTLTRRKHRHAQAS